MHLFTACVKAADPTEIDLANNGDGKKRSAW
jgi:hypothetical protein